MKNNSIQSIENPKLKERLYNYTVEDTSVLSRGVSVPVTITYPQAEDGNKYPMVVMVHGFGGNRHENGGFTLVSNQLAVKCHSGQVLPFAYLHQNGAFEILDL